MATMSYKCPNCDGPLKFDPDKQKFTCEFCLGEFAPDQVQQMNEEKEQRETYDEQEVRHAEQQQQQAPRQEAPQQAAPQQADGSWTCGCGAVNAGKFCSECGTPKPEAPKKRFCGNCGAQLSEGQKFCPECGTKQ